MGIIAAWLASVCLSPAIAHFVYLIPSEADPSRVVAVFTDYLRPDINVPISRIEKTRLFRVLPDGELQMWSWTAGASQLNPDPSAAAAVIVATTDYGVSSGRHSGNVPNRLNYYSKIVQGDFQDRSVAELSGGHVLTIAPLDRASTPAGTQFRFRVQYQDQPLGDAECHVLVPGQDKPITVATDTGGVATLPIEIAGLYGIRVKAVEEGAGEVDGKPYAATHHWSTLVLHLSPAEN